MSDSGNGSVTFHDVLDPLTGQRTSIRIEDRRVVERGTGLASQGRDVDGSTLWILPGLYDADEHFPLASLGVRETDRLAALHGGITALNVAIQWQEVRDRDIEQLAREAARESLPRVIPILSVAESGSDGFTSWIAEHAKLVASVLPPVCKLYSSDANFWENLAAVWAADLLPIVYCYDLDALLGVIERAKAPVHFRHAISRELVEIMRRLPGATLQTSPHFLLPVPEAVRSQLWVLPPVADDAVRSSLLDVFLDEIDLLVTDHNGPPFRGSGKGPGVQAAHTFLPAVLSLAQANDWPLAEVLKKATSSPAKRFDVTLEESFTIVDPEDEGSAELWSRQTPDRAPFKESPLRGRVVVAAAGEQALLL